jgi:phosphatidylethanolamine-binding protein (PEBP) family uncharacterized protein
MGSLLRSQSLFFNSHQTFKVYGGPNPPSGSHDYAFTLYALKTEKLDLPEKVSPATVILTVEQSSLATAKLVGTFARKREP